MTRRHISPGFTGFDIHLDEMEIDGITILGPITIGFDDEGEIDSIFVQGLTRPPLWVADAVASWAKSKHGANTIDDAREEARWGNA